MNNEARGFFGCLFQMIYIGMGLLHLAAILGGIEH